MSGVLSKEEFAARPEGTSMSDLRELPALRKRAFELAIPAECRDLAIRVAEVIKTRDDFDRGQQDEPLRRVIDYLPHARNVLDVFAASGLLVDPPELDGFA